MRGKARAGASTRSDEAASSRKPTSSREPAPRCGERGEAVRILLWHVHGSWTTGFVQGGHHYVVPVVPGRGPDGIGRARSWNWPVRVREIPPARLRDEQIDVVVLQRPREAQLVHEWTGRIPGLDV